MRVPLEGPQFLDADATAGPIHENTSYEAVVALHAAWHGAIRPGILELRRLAHALTARPPEDAVGQHWDVAGTLAGDSLPVSGVGIGPTAEDCPLKKLSESSKTVPEHSGIRPLSVFFSSCRPREKFPVPECQPTARTFDTRRVLGHSIRPSEKINSTILLVFFSVFGVVPAGEYVKYSPAGTP